MTNGSQISPLNRSDKASPYSKVFEGDCKLELRHSVITTKRFSNVAIIEKTMLNAMFVNITFEFAGSCRTPRQISSLEMFSPSMSSLFFCGFVKFNEAKFVVAKKLRYVNPIQLRPNLSGVSSSRMNDWKLIYLLKTSSFSLKNGAELIGTCPLTDGRD